MEISLILDDDEIEISRYIEIIQIIKMKVNATPQIP